MKLFIIHSQQYFYLFKLRAKVLNFLSQMSPTVNSLITDSGRKFKTPFNLSSYFSIEQNINLLLLFTFLDSWDFFLNYMILRRDCFHLLSIINSWEIIKCISNTDFVNWFCSIYLRNVDNTVRWNYKPFF